MQSHEQCELRRYLYLTKECRDIATTIHPHYEKMYPDGVCQMTALDPELSKAPLAIKIEFAALNLETLRELQSRVSETASSSAPSTANTNLRRHQPAGRPPRSSSAMADPAPPFPPMPPIPQPPAGFLQGWKRHSTGKPVTDRQLFWEFCFKETWRQQRLLHQRELLDAFHAHEAAQGREIGVGHEKVLQKRERSFYIVDLWTATGIRMQPNQQIVAKSLAMYWTGRKGKLDEWMQDWLTKRQPAPNPSDPHPASRAFVRYIHENHAKNGQWPVHGEEQDTQFLHAVYLPSDISDQWEAAPPSTRAPADAVPDTDVGSDGGEPNGGHAPADAAPDSEAAKGRAPADVEHDTNVGSDGCEPYGGDEGGGGGSDG